MARPLIGITTSLAPESARQPERAVMNAPYITAVQAAGGVAILLSPYHDAAALDSIMPLLGGLVLTGGGDVSPARYGEEPAGTMMESVRDLRDDFEVATLERAMAREMPLLLICRGMQLANVALGGTLVQDIGTAMPEALEHSQNERRDDATHSVALLPGNALSDLLGTELQVNSMHHQAVKAPGRGFEVVGCAPDGVVEAMVMPGYSAFAMAVQWHPEHLAKWQPESQRLFAAFVSAAG